MVMQWTVNPPASATPGSIPGYSTKFGLVAQLVSAHACHAWGRGFESRPVRQTCSVRLSVRTLAFHAGKEGFDSPTEHQHYRGIE